MQKCGECTLCCKLLNVPETNSPSGTDCMYCVVDRGCSIYDERPEGCKEFSCAWHQMEKVGAELRPDKCNVVFEKWSDNVMVGVTNSELSDLVKGQIRHFNGEGISVIISNLSKSERWYYFAGGHSEEFVKREINDSPKLHRRPN